MLNEKLYSLRKKKELSQEGLSETLGVSRQAVQKWETGASKPDIDNLIAIAKYYGVSIEWLLDENDRRTTEEIRLNRKITPKYENIHVWESYSSQLMTEFVQSFEEGKDIESLKGLFEHISLLKPTKEKEQLADILFRIVLNAPQRQDYEFNEPSSLKEIKALRPAKEIKFDKLPPKEILKDKIHGAWLGRICGCLLGKPIEGIRTNELIPLLKETDNYPMHRYILTSDLNDEIYAKYSFYLKGRCFADTVECAPVDDDTNYTVLGYEIIKRYGRDFTPAQVAEAWVDLQPKNAYCTAERVAFRNFIAGFYPPESAEYKNPYREWIGAQIRADYFGYINPGNPELAAEMAWRDASISHVKNGIYGEMFVAAMLACAAVSDSVEQVLSGGLMQIPETSRLYKNIMKIYDSYKGGMSETDCFKQIHKDYNEFSGHDWCHTISNAEIVAAALLYGDGDFGKSICLAVEAGFDTDCNGATVGSVIGLLKGRACISEQWSKPINNMLDTSIFGVGRVKIDKIAEKTMEHFRI